MKIEIRNMSTNEIVYVGRCKIAAVNALASASGASFESLSRAMGDQWRSRDLTVEHSTGKVSL